MTIGDPGPTSLFDGAVYDRGAMTLHALRTEIGDDDFFDLVKEWIASQAGGNVTTAEFQALAERVSGEDLDAFFRTWLFTPAKPAGIAPAPAAKSKKSALARGWSTRHTPAADPKPSRGHRQSLGCAGGSDPRRRR